MIIYYFITVNRIKKQKTVTRAQVPASSPVRVKVTDWSCENFAPPLCAVYHLIGCCLCQSPSRLSCLLLLLSQSVSERLCSVSQPHHELTSPREDSSHPRALDHSRELTLKFGIFILFELKFFKLFQWSDAVCFGDIKNLSLRYVTALRPRWVSHWVGQWVGS